jgi:hypothetical protein
VQRKLPELPKIDAPPYPKVAQFFKEKATTRAEGSPRPAETALMS